MNKWQQKLLAFLHDPPHKALDISGHEQAREMFYRAAGFTDPEDIRAFEKSADWWASAADRFPAFTSDLRSSFGGAAHPFIHPLSGTKLEIPEFPTAELLGDKLQQTQPPTNRISSNVTGEERDRLNFFLHWRRWPVEAAQKEWRAAFQPAETRLPDHPIWLHNSITSAIQGCEGKPAFLMLQLGPVQDFIAQARSTRDLWSGSYLLSWLIAHAIKAVTDVCGPDAIIFPFLRAQPLFDLLHRDEIYKKVTFDSDTLWKRLKTHEHEMLVPSLPNRFLAIVPANEAGELARAAENAIHTELNKIGENAWNWLNKRQPLQEGWKQRFRDQIKSFAQVHWQITPWENFQSPENADASTSNDGKRVDAAIAEFAAFAPESAEALKQIKKCGSPYKFNPGFLWPYHYALADRLLAARRNTRDVESWMPEDADKAGAPKDTFSGKEEVIGDEAWWKAVTEKHPELKFIFRSSDKFGAINLIKKVWHKAYLAEVWKLKIGQALSFESVPGVAAGAWRTKAVETLRVNEKAWTNLLNLAEAVKNAAPKVGIEIRSPESERRFIEDNDPEIFFDETWRKDAPHVLPALTTFFSESGLPRPPSYFAVLALDGDDMGRWLSGEKTPLLKDQFSTEAREKFGATLGNVRRPLSPSYHLQFSEALSNFSLYLARPIVEHFGGQLIYAGGDDVLAMLPAREALDCAAALRAAFRGETPKISGVYEMKAPGFVQLLNPKGEQPTYPLIVPGPRADASCGISIGHIHAPLQSMIRAAQEAERRAKNRRTPQTAGQRSGAFEIALHKRSGEITHWGATWDSGSLDLFDSFIENNEDISGKFAYALNELLHPYTPASKAIANAEGFDAYDVAQRELKRVLERQIPKKKELKEKLFILADIYMQKLDPPKILSDLPLLFRSATFILRGERA